MSARLWRRASTRVPPSPLSTAASRFGDLLLRAARRIIGSPALPPGPVGAVVMVAYWFPPHTEVGAARPARFVRYLRQSGTPVAVVCSSGSLRRGTDQEALASLVEDTAVQRVPGPVLSLGERAGAAILQGLQRLMPNNDRLSWLPSGYRAGARALTSGSILISTHPPVVTHLTALALKLRYGRPWVADFRDPLLLNPCRTTRRAKWVDTVLEGIILGAADAVIANTEGAAEVLRRRYPGQAGKVNTIWNGFDPDTAPLVSTPRAGGRCRIAHVGTLYASRTLLPLAHSLRRLIKAGLLRPEATELRQIGRADPECFDLRDPALAFLRDQSCLYRSPRQLPVADAHREMSEADIVLLLDSHQSFPTLQVPAKTFEYVQSGKPILAFTSSGSATEYVLRLSGVPHVCIDTAQNAAAIDLAVLWFISARHVASAASPRFLADFNGAEQTKTLLGLLDRVKAAERAARGLPRFLTQDQTHHAPNLWAVQQGRNTLRSLQTNATGNARDRHPDPAKPIGA